MAFTTFHIKVGRFSDPSYSVGLISGIESAVCCLLSVVCLFLTLGHWGIKLIYWYLNQKDLNLLYTLALLHSINGIYYRGTEMN